jgi:hypothetical protein
MANVLLEYQQVALQNERRRPDDGPLPVVTIAFDEKPGLHAICAEFIALLKDLDSYYPPECTIRLIPDNHSAHLSSSHLFFVTPFLRHIRVASWDEPKARILLGVAGINAAPVVHRWKKFGALDEIMFC